MSHIGSEHVRSLQSGNAGDIVAAKHRKPVHVAQHRLEGRTGHSIRSVPAENQHPTSQDPSTRSPQRYMPHNKHPSVILGGCGRAKASRRTAFHRLRDQSRTDKLQRPGVQDSFRAREMSNPGRYSSGSGGRVGEVYCRLLGQYRGSLTVCDGRSALGVSKPAARGAVEG